MKPEYLKIPMKSKDNLAYLKKEWQLYFFLIIPILLLVLFKYLPMTNIVIAFKDFNMFLKNPTWDSPWAGLKYFTQAFNDQPFLRALRNTIVLNFLDLIVGFPAPIILALLLNELIFKKFKRFTQTVLYLPHFMSWIIIAGLSLQILSPNTGLVNNFLNNFGIKAIPFLNDKNYWIVSYILIGVWQNAGWGTILYLASMTNINPELYEAADVDGATRWKKIWHVTLPGIKSTIIVLLILNLGRIMSIPFDRPYAIGNFFVADYSDVISTYVYRCLQSLKFPLATAVGLFQSVVNIVFLLAANFIAEKFGESGVL